jgi:hypothetical protein
MIRVRISARFNRSIGGSAKLRKCETPMNTRPRRVLQSTHSRAGFFSSVCESAADGTTIAIN